VNFIEDNNENPFFLYFPLPAPHTPILPTEEFEGSTGLSSYGDFVVMVDAVVGDIVTSLREQGILDNTMVVFVADNGCAPVADIEGMEEKGHFPSYIFRGHKADIFEGGHRVPFIVHYPKSVGGRTSDALISTVDLLATIAEDADLKYADTEAPDSFSFMNILTSDEDSARASLVHHSIDGEFAIRRDEWKLIMTAGSGGWSYPRRGANDSILQVLPDRQLYNMADDPGETKNLLDEYPEVAEELETELKLIILQGRSTSGPELKNDPVEKWPQISFID
jgi:arylsulfatase A-like enzyme